MIRCGDAWCARGHGDWRARVFFRLLLPEPGVWSPAAELFLLAFGCTPTAEGPLLSSSSSSLERSSCAGRWRSQPIRTERQPRPRGGMCGSSTRLALRRMYASRAEHVLRLVLTFARRCAGSRAAITSSLGRVHSLHTIGQSVLHSFVRAHLERIQPVHVSASSFARI